MFFPLSRAFLVAILNDTRQKIIEAKFPVKQKSSKLLQEIPKRDPVLVGIIGCGRLGKQLANTLLKFSDVQPEELFLSSRRPETLSSFQEKGVNCGFDNIKVSGTARAVVMGFVHFVFIAYSRPVNSNCETQEHVVVSHLFCFTAAIVQTKEEWAVLAVFVFINMCTGMGLQQDEIISLCNTIMFGLGPTDDPQDGISLDDINCDDDTLTISSNMEDKQFFPLFDLGNVIAKQKRLEQRLLDSNKNLRRMFAKRYRAVFDKFQYWKGVPTKMP
ncbi:PREDICTED: uncharacterized protein LOC107344204 [Acropora digitifera]|uniref:uncharacterized protein LOC107344204 n=1 Tax=Acropora digitifera TaxID=70779 RepID=UPI00077B01F6|nr:PREDICTED: uncharacterized protein LOC107344204 [Acropora digitifera]